ncbi:MAG: hypothetical protein HQL38_00060 [Alphaproteobacteria bacterium]|nr:hypothetical protein [Alphaproteobacteria bacterium]
MIPRSWSIVLALVALLTLLGVVATLLRPPPPEIGPGIAWPDFLAPLDKEPILRATAAARAMGLGGSSAWETGGRSGAATLAAPPDKSGCARWRLTLYGPPHRIGFVTLCGETK